MHPPVHPGKVLADELAELNITPTELARQIAVPANRLSQIIRGKRSITGDTALRLGHWFGTSPQFWLNSRAAYDIPMAEAAVGAEIRRLAVRPRCEGRLALEGVMPRGKRYSMGFSDPLGQCTPTSRAEPPPRLGRSGGA